MNLKWTWVITTCWNLKTGFPKRSSFKIFERILAKGNWILKARLWEATWESLRINGVIKARFCKERSLTLVKDQCFVGRNSET